MQTLFPAIKPYASHTLDVDCPHSLYIEECGNPDGIPVLFLHGGPGAGCDKSHRQFFDPKHYRIVLFDQRGCGKSKPHASLENNNTPALIRDIESIRKFLNINQWLVFGGSWGSTLALLYAQAHTEHVSGMILRAIFLCRDKDIDWFYQQGASRIFPDYWRDFIKPIKPAQRDNMVKAYYQRLTGDDELARMAAAKAWSIWEARCASLKLSKDLIAYMGDPHTAVSMARIECHYFINNAFIEPGQILDNIEKIRDIPSIIIHGRYDVICPVDQAIDLHDVWPKSQLRIIDASGHSAFEPLITDALLQATREMADKLA